MNCKTKTLLVLALLITSVSLIWSDSASAQTQTYVADTGVITLQPGQILRLCASGVGSETATIWFRKKEYADSVLGGGVVRKQLMSQSATGAITIAPDQAASSDIQITTGQIRGEIVSTSRNLKVTAFVISPAPSSSSGSNGSSIMPMEQISFNFTNITFE